MTYDHLRRLCLRVLNFHPDAKESVSECFEHAFKMPPEHSIPAVALMAAYMVNYIEGNQPPAAHGEGDKK